MDNSPAQLPEGIAEHLLEWKVRYGSVYTTEIERVLCAYRALTLEEVQALNTFHDTYLAERAILKACLLWPEDPFFSLPGSYTALATQIRGSSGWGSEEDLKTAIEEQREQGNNQSDLAIAIAQTLGLPVERVMGATLEQFAAYAVAYEKAAGRRIFRGGGRRPPAPPQPQEMGKLGAAKASAKAHYEFSLGMQDALSQGSRDLGDRIATDRQSPGKRFDWERDLKEIQRNMGG